MPDLSKDGDIVHVQGSGKKPYTLKNTGGVLSCECPAWRNQSLPIERRTCKHLRKVRGNEAEEARVGTTTTTDDADFSKAEPVNKNVPPLLLAHKWDGAEDISGWWMSEKLDGVRAYWNGQVFISRLGGTFHVPDWFCVGMPTIPLDGEFWIDRKQFQRTSGLVRRQDKSETWKEIKYLVFDAPALNEAFETRIEYVGRVRTDYARGHTHIRCSSIDHLKKELARVELLGGEGLMLRQPGSMYEEGRSNTLLKVKTFFDDDATVVGYEPGKGRHKGRVGAINCQWKGVDFKVGTGLSDEERRNPPPIGSTIIFRYQETTDGGVPRFPSYVGIRAD